MGVYVYGMKNKTITVDNTEISQLVYAYKPYWGIASYDKKYTQMVNRKERFANVAAKKLNDRGVKHFTMNDGKFKVGQTVYRINGDFHGLYYDDVFDGNQCTRVGFLSKKGRKWVIVDEYPLEA